MQNRSKTITIIIFFTLILIAGYTLSLKGKTQNYLQKPTNYINKTFQISGNKDDLISFSILPGQKVSGIVEFTGSVKNGYFFEGNILINILDLNKNALKKSYAMATTNWMTSEPVNFTGKIDFTVLPKGLAYFEIHNDNPSDIRANDKNILIPIIIE